MIGSMALFSAARRCVFFDEKERQVLMSLCDMAGLKEEDASGKPYPCPRWECYPGYRTLAEFSGMSERHAKRAVKVLEAMGVIRTIKRSSRTSLYLINHIWLDMISDEIKVTWRSAQQNDDHAAYEMVKRETGALLYSKGIGPEDMPPDWPQVKLDRAKRIEELQRCVAKLVSASHLKWLGLVVDGDTVSPSQNVENASKKSVENKKGVSPCHPGGVGGVTPGVSGASPNPPNNPQGKPQGAEERPEGEDPDQGAPPVKPEYRPPPVTGRAGNEDPGPEETLGKLDQDRHGEVKALERATAYWIASGVWRKPSGRTLPIGPPPDADGYLLHPINIRKLIDDVTQPILAGRAVNHDDGAVSAIARNLIIPAFEGRGEGADAAMVRVRMSQIKDAHASADRALSERVRKVREQKESGQAHG